MDASEARACRNVIISRGSSFVDVILEARASRDVIISRGLSLVHASEVRAMRDVITSRGSSLVHASKVRATRDVITSRGSSLVNVILKLVSETRASRDVRHEPLRVAPPVLVAVSPPALRLRLREDTGDDLPKCLPKVLGKKGIEDGVDAGVDVCQHIGSNLDPEHCRRDLEHVETFQ